MMKFTKLITLACAAMLCSSVARAQISDVRWDSHSLIIDGRRVELRVLPLQKDMPIYFPREAIADKEGEEVFDITIAKCD